MAEAIQSIDRFALEQWGVAIASELNEESLLAYNRSRIEKAEELLRSFGIIVDESDNAMVRGAR